MNIRIPPLCPKVVFCFFYFAISDISRMLLQIGVPRFLPYFCWCIFLLMYVAMSLKKMRIIDWVIQFVFTVLPLLGLLHYSRYIASFSNIFAVIIKFIPAYYIFRTIDIADIGNAARKAAVFSGIYLLFYYIFSVRSIELYDMEYSYWIAFPATMNFYIFIHERKMLNLLLSLGLLGTGFLSGSRGGPLLIAACCLYYFYRSRMSSKKNLAVSFLGSMALGTVLWLNYKKVIIWLSKYSYSSRNVQKMLSGDYFSSGSREILYDKCKDLIERNKWGYGVLSSRKLIMSDPYPHSLFFELQIDYGKYVGIMLVGVIIVICFFFLFLVQESAITPLVTYIIIVGIGSLIVSSSMYYEYYIPALIGLFLNYLNTKEEGIDDDCCYVLPYSR